MTRRELSDEELVAGMVATAAEVASTLPESTDRAITWVIARMQSDATQRRLAEALAEVTRAETEASLLRKRATRAELECELLQARLARLREQLERSPDVDQPAASPPPPPPADPTERDSEPAAAQALRKWLERRPLGNIDNNGAA